MSVDKHWVKTMFKEYVKAQKKWVKESGIKLNDKVILVHGATADQLKDFPLSYERKVVLLIVTGKATMDARTYAMGDDEMPINHTYRVVGISPYGIRIMQMNKRVNVSLFDVPFYCLARVI